MSFQVSNLDRFESMVANANITSEVGPVTVVVNHLMRPPTDDYPANAGWSKQQAMEIATPALIQILMQEGYQERLLAGVIAGQRDRRPAKAIAKWHKKTGLAQVPNAHWRRVNLKQYRAQKDKGFTVAYDPDTGDARRLVANTEGLVAWATDILSRLPNYGTEAEVSALCHDKQEALEQLAYWYARFAKTGRQIEIDGRMVPTFSDYRVSDDLVKNTVCRHVAEANDWTGAADEVVGGKGFDAKQQEGTELHRSTDYREAEVAEQRRLFEADGKPAWTAAPAVDEDAKRLAAMREAQKAISGFARAMMTGSKDLVEQVYTKGYEWIQNFTATNELPQSEAAAWQDGLAKVREVRLDQLVEQELNEQLEEEDDELESHRFSDTEEVTI